MRIILGTIASTVQDSLVKLVELKAREAGSRPRRENRIIAQQASAKRQGKQGRRRRFWRDFESVGERALSRQSKADDGSG